MSEVSGATAPVIGEEALDRLVGRGLIVVTGKGGVGKSALAAAIARALARRGRRTLTLEVDPRENLHQLFDVPPSGGQAVTVMPGLLLQNLKPQQVVDWVVRRQVKIEMLVKRVLDSPIYHRFVEGAPGLKEMAILGHALRLLRGETPGIDAVDTVVLDAPATGHGIYLLTASRLFADAIGEGPFADMAREVAELTADAERTGLVVVTLAEEMPVQESLELREALEEQFGRSPELLVINGVYPPVPEAATATGGDADELLDLWRHRRQVNERELNRLEQTWSGPRLVLPLEPVDRGAELVARLERGLEERPVNGTEALLP
ncbi:MAG: ArsA-related P-loop ATPase [Acidobacteriota bacterium]